MDLINRQERLARDVGVGGTPTFLLGKTSPVGAAGVLIEGAPSLEMFEAKIDDLLTQTDGAKKEYPSDAGAMGVVTH
jgi:protein-disulfide isomerase